MSLAVDARVDSTLWSTYGDEIVQAVYPGGGMEKVFKKKLVITLPYKSTALGLVLSLVLGPIGLLYATTLGGIVMTVFGLAAIGAAAQSHTPYPLYTVWIISCIWTSFAIARYNKRLFRDALKD